MAVTGSGTYPKHLEEQLTPLAPAYQNNMSENGTPTVTVGTLSELDAVYRYMCDKFKRMGEEGEQLDIYHIASFLKYYHVERTWHCPKYAFCLLKMFICALIQTLGMVAFFMPTSTSTSSSAI